MQTRRSNHCNNGPKDQMSQISKFAKIKGLTAQSKFSIIKNTDRYVHMYLDLAMRPGTGFMNTWSNFWHHRAQ